MPDSAASVPAEIGPRICMVVPHLGPGGAQRVAALIANEWAQRGWSVHLVLATDRPADVVALHPAIERSVLAPRGGRRVDLSRKGAAGAPAISVAGRIRRFTRERRSVC